jgi:hypothetical protein
MPLSTQQQPLPAFKSLFTGGFTPPMILHHALTQKRTPKLPEGLGSRMDLGKDAW